ncbi:MAG: Gfo/Idh/MocA family protein [Candidatus Puniceispirillaceae bacterium]
MDIQKWQIGVVGAGYFAQLHHEAWQRSQMTSLVGIADRNPQAMSASHIPRYASLTDLLLIHDIDVLDIVTPPSTHAKLITQAIAAGVTHIICQKPFCNSLAEAQDITKQAIQAGAQIVIHENFRHQPWYRALRAEIDENRFGDLYQLRFALRPGDGRGPEAYKARQPYFQQMPRFLVHETAIHFLDVFRYLFGKPMSVYADLRKLNPVIKGEDAGLIIMEFDNNKRAIFDGNRLSDHKAANPRLTMGEAWLETQAGEVKLTGDGALHLRPHGQMTETCLLQPYQTTGNPSDFGGDCVFLTCEHIISSWSQGINPENVAQDYLSLMGLVEKAYQSASEGRRIIL